MEADAPVGDDPFEVVAYNEEEHARFELRRYLDRWQMVHLRHRVGGGWYVKDSLTVTGLRMGAIGDYFGAAATEERLRVVERVRAAVRLLYPDDMTPTAKRVLESILDEEADRD